MPRRPALGLFAALLVALSSLVATPPALAADRDCGDFGSQREAQIFFLNSGGPQSDPHRLDSDSDGIACESNPAPYYYGTNPPGGGGSDEQPQVTAIRSTVRLALRPSSRIAGEPYRMRVSVRPAIRRKVLVQRKVAGRWKFFGKGVTGRNGKTHGTFRSPKRNVTYRAVVQPVRKGNKKYSAATSRSRTLKIQHQRIKLNFDDRTVPQGERIHARVRATPVRVGRTVVLQIRSEGTWRTVKSSTFNRRGRAAFTITSTLGKESYRAVALRHRGAAPEQSNAVKVIGIDVTPPPAPYDLVAVPGDRAVHLSWFRVLPADFAHHQVWMRTADTPWSLVTETESDNTEVTLLQNGVTYWFTVTSVDSNGNVSEVPSEVAATPTAPSTSGKFGS